MTEHEELAQWLYRLADERTCNRRRGIRPHPSALTRAAVLLQQARPQPVPSEEEIETIAGQTLAIETLGIQAFAHQLLQRFANPQSVPVAERPWERPGWCDEQGRCWWLVLDQSWPCLYLMKPNSALTANPRYHCLPHWAIPIPTEPTTTETPNG